MTGLGDVAAVLTGAAALISATATLIELLQKRMKRNGE